MKRRSRRHARLLTLRTLRFARRHYVTAVSGAVLAVAAVLALTSAGPGQGVGAPQAGEQRVSVSASSLAPATYASTRPLPATPRRSRPLIFYLVDNEVQGAAVMQTHALLKWDNRQPGGDTSPLVRYLVAATPQQEARAIQALNYYLEVAAQRGLDLRVVDIRAGHAE